MDDLYLIMDVLDSQESSRGDPGCKSSYVDHEPVFKIYEVRCVTNLTTELLLYPCLLPERHDPPT